MIELSPFMQTLLTLALYALTFMLIPALYRLLRGPRVADRMLGVDMVTTLLSGIIILLAIIEQQPLLIDLALALAALSFIATFAVARFVAEGRVF